MIGHKVKCSIKSNEYIRYYQCGNFHYKSSSVCSSNLVLADDSEEYVFKRLHLLSRNNQVLSNVLSKVNQELHKHVLHSIISKITVNEGKRPKERSIKDIELFIDTSLYLLMVRFSSICGKTYSTMLYWCEYGVSLIGFNF